MLISPFHISSHYHSVPHACEVTRNLARLETKGDKNVKKVYLNTVFYWPLIVMELWIVL